MKYDDVLNIIDLCIVINYRAWEIYVKLAKAEDNKELRRFWAEMAREEKKQEDFWHKTKEIAKELGLPQLFDDSLAARHELEQILKKIEILISRWQADKSRENALILAYRLEYYMIHPTFELLYHTLKPFGTESDPEDDYDLHVKRFIEMFVRHGNITPELELLGETLQGLWQRNKALTKLAMVDGLTGLLNRRGFLILAKELCYLGQRNKENMGLLMIDIDKFKKINDKHGHPQGDKVLQVVATLLKSSVRKSDIIGRFGGEEFIILFPAILPDALHRIAEKMRREVEQVPPAGIPVTISVGLIQGMMQSHLDSELFNWIAKADKSLYQAKANGRNCVVSAA